MPDSRIYDLTAGTPASADVFPYTNGTTTYKTTFDTAGSVISALTATNDGWIAASGTWAYISGTTVGIPTSGTAYYALGDKIKYVQGGTVKWAYAINLSGTILTIFSGIDYTVENAAITSAYYSKYSSPVGFPQTFNWTPSYGGFSTDPTGVVSRFDLSGNKIHFVHNEGTNGTSNANTFSISLPITAKTITDNFWGGQCFFVVDNSVVLSSACRWNIESAGTIISIFANMGTTGFTTSGGKRARLQGWYEI